jgi:hypothetical protein
MARAQRHNLTAATLPVIVPQTRGPAYIRAEYTAHGIRFIRPDVTCPEIYDLREDWHGNPVLVRRDLTPPSQST